MDNNIAVLKIIGIKKAFGATQALKGVNLDVFDNEVHAVVGSNGAGKSTLMKILAGIYTPDAGRIICGGKDIAGLSPHELQRRGIQVVHQALNIVPSLSVLENILLARPPMKGGFLNWKAGAKRAEETLEFMDLHMDLGMIAGNLSVSEQQFVILARAIVNETRILVLDEPTARLSMEETNKLFAVIGRMKSAGATVLYISHRMEEIYKITDRISVFRDGVCVKTEYTDRFSENELVGAMLGKKMEVFFPKKDIAIGGELLRVNGLKYRDKLSDVGFHVNHGEIVSLVGAVGSGVTEVLNCVYGVANADGGEMFLDGQKLPLSHKPAEAISLGIALIPEDRVSEGMFGDYDVKNNLSSVDMDKISGFSVLRAGAEENLARGIVDRLSVIPADINYLASALSGGNQQKIAIGKWMTRPYRLYLMNNVTAGVDIGAKAEIYKLMGDMAESGSALILATGDIEEALGVSDRIIVLFQGRVLKELSPKETTKDELLTYIMGGASEWRTAQN
jgi:simple sugar transport system ATP-binding protein